MKTDAIERLIDACDFVASQTTDGQVQGDLVEHLNDASFQHQAIKDALRWRDVLEDKELPLVGHYNEIEVIALSGRQIMMVDVRFAPTPEAMSALFRDAGILHWRPLLPGPEEES